MGSWLVKAATQGAISLVPGRTRLNLAFQENVTGSVELTERAFELKVRQAARHLRRRDRVVDPRRPLRAAFELGTGWYPIVPVALALSGVERVVSFDVAELGDEERAGTVVDFFARAHARGRLAELLPRLDASRAALLTSEPSLEALGVELHVGDAAATGLPRRTFDLFVSSNTFEHIPPGELRAILAEMRRLGRRRAVMDHFIDMRDHYASFDESISRLNFLRYPDPVWRLFNNRLQYQNRLRLPDYRRLMTESGFRVKAVKRRRGRPGEFDDLELARRFREDYTRRQALVLFAWVTAVKRRPASPRR